MNQYSSIKSLKTKSRGDLIGNYTVLITSFLVIYGISYVSSTVLQTFMMFDTTISYIIYAIASIIVQLILMIFSLGSVKQYLMVATSKKTTIPTLFYGFTHQPNKVLLLSIMLFGILYLIYFLLAIPFIGIGVLVLVLFPDFPIVLSVLYCVVCYIFILLLLFIISARFALIFCLLADLPTYSCMQIMKLSNQLTKGNVWRYFTLQFSFIGLYLLGILSCGVAFFWILPYQQMTLINFYLDLMRIRTAPAQPVQSVPEQPVPVQPAQEDDVNFS